VSRSKGKGYTLRLDERAIRVHVGGIAEDCAHAGAKALQTRVRHNITTAGRVDTTAMRNSFTIKKADGWPNPSFSVGSDLHYTVYQEEGIGPVTPKRAKFLRFKPKGSRTFVFTKRTRGFPGAHFFKRAVASMDEADFTP
jgi:hypothetical protein